MQGWFFKNIQQNKTYNNLLKTINMTVLAKSYIIFQTDLIKEIFQLKKQKYYIN